ncbi:MAG: hypothetical protein ABFD46_06265 [Armatimonadota bacterium]
MTRNNWQLVLAISLFITLLCAPAHATAGAALPILLIVPGAVALGALFLVFLLVKVLAARLIIKTGWGSSFLLALKASAVSTLVGVPLVAVALSIVAMSFRIPVLCCVAFVPIEGELVPDWQVNVALAILLAVSGVAATWWDKRAARKGVEKRPAWDEDGSVNGDPAEAWAWTANAICYGLVIVILLFTIPK